MVNAIDRLKADKKWVAWRYAKRKGGKPTKPPVDPSTGRAAKVSDPLTWGTYEEALARQQADKLAGVGYVMTEDDDLTGADLDHVRDAATGVIIPWADEIVKLAETYTEVSPSGTGLRLFWLGKIPKSIKNDRQSVEIYRDGRYLTITGNHVEGTPLEINHAPLTEAALLKRAAEGKPEEEKEKKTGDAADVVEINDWHRLNSAALKSMNLWVPHLFGEKAKPSGDGGYRVSSKALGRNLQEDLSLTTEGIVDFGISDMGDPRQGKRTPINLVMEHKGVLFNDAVKWLCESLGVAKPSVLLAPSTPYLSAKELMRCLYTSEDSVNLLQRHRGAFWLHSRGCYRQITDERLKNSVWRFLYEANKIIPAGRSFKTVPFAPKTSNVSDVASACNSVCELDDFIAPPAWLGDMDLPPASEFMSFANGLLHIPSGELYPHTPEFFNVFASGAEFDPDAKEPELWLKFLGETLVDPDAISTLQEWVGYTLTPDTGQQKMLMCIGPRRSGKGTLARIHTALLGMDSVAGPTMSSLGENFGLESLITKSLAIISDARIGRADKSAIVERLLSISGEDAITVPRKFLPAWSGRLPTRFAVMTNEIPSLSDGSGALAGRFLILEFQQSFYGREDPALTNKLMAEISGILNWAIAGYRRLMDRGHFVQPPNSQNLVDQMETLGSPVKLFIEDRCKIGHEQQCEVDALYSRWKEWCEGEGRIGSMVGTKEWFGRNLHTAITGLKIVRRRDGASRARMYLGIGLQSDPDEVL